VFFGGFGDGFYVFGGVATAAADEIDEAVGGEVVGVVGHVLRF